MASIANDDAVAEEQEKGRGKKKKSRRNKKMKDQSSSKKNLSFKEKQELRKSSRRKRGSQSNDAICAVNLGTLVSSVLASRMVVAVSQGIVQKVKDQKFLRLIKENRGQKKRAGSFDIESDEITKQEDIHRLNIFQSSVPYIDVNTNIGGL